jgi:hypothetical protein
VRGFFSATKNAPVQRNAKTPTRSAGSAKRKRLAKHIRQLFYQ